MGPVLLVLAAVFGDSTFVTIASLVAAALQVAVFVAVRRWRRPTANG